MGQWLQAVVLHLSGRSCCLCFAMYGCHSDRIKSAVLLRDRGRCVCLCVCLCIPMYLGSRLAEFRHVVKSDNIVGYLWDLYFWVKLQRKAFYFE